MFFNHLAPFLNWYKFGTNLLTKFHEDGTINVSSSVNKVLMKNALHPVLKPTGTISELFQVIIGKTFMNKFHDDRTINMAFRPDHIQKYAQTPGGHVFNPTGTIFELVHNLIGTNPLTEFHELWTINVASRGKHTQPPGRHVFQPTKTIFELVQYIIGTNLLNKFHDDRTINMASRVLTRIRNIHIKEKCSAPLEPYKKCGTRVLTRQMLTTDDKQKGITKAHH
ncbi:hypothetical protein DPMN_035385 [Dreissena polymorpha]|uniref:Uncharacterized protein n=1 Tax=Dreissena polymorpha TaxID=45954 RepID=A0A9D4MBS5_DREPO|nr:hypothetical protein DPMN_035385 [Dreissena polymorpha]